MNAAASVAASGIARGVLAAEEPTHALSLEHFAIAAGLAALAGLSLLIGAWLGLTLRPPQRVSAVVMAFGAGALIQALAVDLAYEGAERLIVHHAMGPVTSWLYVALGFLAGGTLYTLATRAIEHRGAALRKQSTARVYLARTRDRWVDAVRHLHVRHLEHPEPLHPNELADAEHQHLMPVALKHHGETASMAIFLGALIDGIPESVVIGASFAGLATFNPGFLMAVFLSNLPEAMSSAVGMAHGGIARGRILTMWSSLVVVGAIAAALGNALLAGASPVTVTIIEAVAGGGILAMLAETMMPEAFEEGGPIVGLATAVGFLAAFFFTALRLG